MVRFKISSMTCGHCVSTIEKAIAAIDAKAVVSADVAQREITVQGDLAEADISEALKAAGYESEKIAA